MKIRMFTGLICTVYVNIPRYRYRTSYQTEPVFAAMTPQQSAYYFKTFYTLQFYILRIPKYAQNNITKTAQNNKTKNAQNKITKNAKKYTKICTKQDTTKCTKQDTKNAQN